MESDLKAVKSSYFHKDAHNRSAREWAGCRDVSCSRNNTTLGEGNMNWEPESDNSRGVC
jgi:hypothetical protein